VRFGLIPRNSQNGYNAAAKRQLCSTYFCSPNQSNAAFRNRHTFFKGGGVCTTCHNSPSFLAVNGYAGGMVLIRAYEYNIPRLWRRIPARDGETQQCAIVHQRQLTSAIRAISPENALHASYSIRAAMRLARYYSESSLRQCPCLAQCPRTLAGTPDLCAGSPFHALLRRRHTPVGCSSPVKSRFSLRGNVELCRPADSPIGRLVIQAFDTWPAVCRPRA
jgi:hypothetical protein